MEYPPSTRHVLSKWTTVLLMFGLIFLLPTSTFAAPSGGCSTSPTPNPATFSSAPSPASASSISMTASTGTVGASCTAPVKYFFGIAACGGANDGTGASASGWQISSSFTGTGLQVNKCYSYTVRLEDSEATAHLTASSTAATTYTLANVPGAPTLGTPTATTLTLTNDENGNPATNPTTDFAVQITAASDATWNTKWVDASGNPSASAVWLTDAQLDGLVLTGLTTSVSYAAQSEARNFNSVATALSSSGSNTTSGGVGTTRSIRLRGGTRLRGGIRLR